MSRVTSVTGKSSGTWLTLRRRNGSFRVARGYSRCSGRTPTACVGTRTKRRGCVSEENESRRKGDVDAGRGAGVGIACGPAASTGHAFATLSSGKGNIRLARFFALISPLRRRDFLTMLWSQKSREHQLCPIPRVERDESSSWRPLRRHSEEWRTR